MFYNNVISVHITSVCHVIVSWVEFAPDIHEKLWDLICDKQLHLKVVTIDDGFTPYQFPSCTQYCVNITTDEGTDVIELLNDTECDDLASNNNDKVVVIIIAMDDNNYTSTC
jgi:hypothetical protein